MISHSFEPLPPLSNCVTNYHNLCSPFLDVWRHFKTPLITVYFQFLKWWYPKSAYPIFIHTCTNLEFNFHPSMHILSHTYEYSWIAILQVGNFQCCFTYSSDGRWINWREAFFIYPKDIRLWLSICFAVQKISTATIYVRVALISLQNTRRFLIKRAPQLDFENKIMLIDIHSCIKQERILNIFSSLEISLLIWCLESFQSLSSSIIIIIIFFFFLPLHP